MPASGHRTAGWAARPGRTRSGTSGCPVRGCSNGSAGATGGSPAWGGRGCRPGGRGGAGMVGLELQSGGDVEIVVFGLVPEFVGRGFGSHLLTVGARLAWEAEHPDGAPTRRVWLHTSSRDHPSARPNYERRGFRAFRTEHRRRDIPEEGVQGGGASTGR